MAVDQNIWLQAQEDLKQARQKSGKQRLMTARSNSKNPVVSGLSTFPNGPENETHCKTCLALD